MKITTRAMLSMPIIMAFVLCAIAAGPVLASGEAINAANLIQENFDRIQTMSCELTMTSKVTYQANATGTFETSKRTRYLLKRPDKIRIEHADGTVEIFNGEEHWWISASADPVELPLTRSPTASLALPPTYLWNMAELGDKLVLSAATTPGANKILEAQVNGSVNATLRNFHIDPVTGMVMKVALYDASGNVYQETELEYEERSGIHIPVHIVENYTGDLNEMTRDFMFTEIRVNEDIPDHLFEP